MFEPTAGEALALVACCTVLWGCWASTYRALGADTSWPNEFWLADLLGTLAAVASLVAATVGAPEGFADLAEADAWRPGLMLLSGGTIVVGNAIMVESTTRLGLALTFGGAISLSLCFGTALTYAVDPAADALPLFGGVLAALVAAGFCFVAYDARDRGSSGSGSGSGGSSGVLPVDAPGTTARATTGARATSTGTAALLLASAGVFTCVWSPMAAAATQQLNVYTAYWCFSVGQLVAGLPLCAAVARRKGIALRSYWAGSRREHLHGVAGGVILSLGNACGFIGSSSVSFAVFFAFGQTSPLVVLALGVFGFREFDKAPRRAWGALAGLTVMYIVAIVLIAVSAP